MVGVLDASVQLRCEVPGTYVALHHILIFLSFVPRTRWPHIPTSVWSPLAVAVMTSWWSRASRGSLALGGGAWRSWCLRWLNQRWVSLTHLQNTQQLVNTAEIRPQILELTLLMADYMNHWNPGVPHASHKPGGQHWDMDGRHFPTMNYTTKGPTLLWTKKHRGERGPRDSTGCMSGFLYLFCWFWRDQPDLSAWPQNLYSDKQPHLFNVK